ncbi:hypothetical protein DJ68_09065 [Halorubrum sp. C3]|nr:hypothetical protein DJ68_09065 [Halorubrum sp. C3]
MTMNPSAVRRGYALSIVVFLTAMVMLVLQLSQPATVVIVGPERSVELKLATKELWTTLTTAAVGVAIGSSGTYLLTTPSGSETKRESPNETPSTTHEADSETSQDLLETRRQEWEHTADRLSDSEQAVYKTILNADGVLPQSEIVEQTERSKATVSRALDSLEAKNLVERKRRGVGNVVILR